MIAVDRAMVVGTGIPPQSDAPFRKVGWTATRNELEKLASGLDSLANKVENLHEPAIRVLAQQSIMRAMLGNPVHLRQIATNIRHADLSGIPIFVPRGSELAVRRATGLVQVLSDDFRNITGFCPTRAVRDNKDYGRFFNLVTEIFLIFGIAESVDAAVQRVMKKRRLKKES